jgi:hypothetical protein
MYVFRQLCNHPEIYRSMRHFVTLCCTNSGCFSPLLYLLLASYCIPGILSHLSGVPLLDLPLRTHNQPLLRRVLLFHLYPGE